MSVIRDSLFSGEVWGHRSRASWNRPTLVAAGAQWRESDKQKPILLDILQTFTNAAKDMKTMYPDKRLSDLLGESIDNWNKKYSKQKDGFKVSYECVWASSKPNLIEWQNQIGNTDE